MTGADRTPTAGGESKSGRGGRPRAGMGDGGWE